MDERQSLETDITGMTRRGFFRNSAYTGGALLWLSSQEATVKATEITGHSTTEPTGQSIPRQLPDLRPAKWLWYPSGRCLPNTFVLFRRDLRLEIRPRRATGWILAESRYMLMVNGRRIQWGPPPCDPRWAEADPIDLTNLLQTGANTLGAQVLFYGFGDGTWPIGKPGFLFWLEIEHADGRIEKLVSDHSWLACLARAWQPGHYKRWYLRALQEEFDARRYPHGWSTPTFKTDRDWLPAMELDCPPDKPAVCSSYPDYMLEIGADRDHCSISPRQIPLMRESLVPATRLAESFFIQWKRSPEEYFECLPPDAFEVDRAVPTSEIAPGKWEVELDPNRPDRGAALTFEFQEQVVGWPRFIIDAPAGTTVELMVHEAHRPGGPPLLNTHYHSWSRFICRAGLNEFECFDFESCRWLQLHIHSANGPVTVQDIAVRRRVFPWPHKPIVQVGEPALQRLMDASINTLHNCAQENCVDGMARERQQYSGDCGHQLHALWFTFGETRLPARYLRTYSQGMTLSGYFLDCWPAFDRLNRVSCREVNLAGWGPILDHGVGFNFDCINYWRATGDRAALEEPFPRLLRFAHYLKSIQGGDGLLPVENIGVPCVWIDHQGFAHQRHKQCAFNLYAAAALQHALAPLCELFGNNQEREFATAFGKDIHEATVRRFWSNERGLFIDNQPWLAEEKGPRLHDRTLATAVLFDLCSNGEQQPAVNALATCPPEMGISYPANAGWRLWALGKAGRADAILHDLRTRWAGMESVTLNNTLAEDWQPSPDSGSQWSHCPVVPLYVLYMNLMGLRPLVPGFGRCEIRPQLADLAGLDAVAHTVRGPIRFHSQGILGNRLLTLALPSDCEGELIVKQQEKLDLPSIPGETLPGHIKYRLKAGCATDLLLRYT